LTIILRARICRSARRRFHSNPLAPPQTLIGKNTDDSKKIDKSLKH